MEIIMATFKRNWPVFIIPQPQISLKLGQSILVSNKRSNHMLVSFSLLIKFLFQIRPSFSLIATYKKGETRKIIHTMMLINQHFIKKRYSVSKRTKCMNQFPCVSVNYLIFSELCQCKNQVIQEQWTTDFKPI